MKALLTVAVLLVGCGDTTLRVAVLTQDSDVYASELPLVVEDACEVLAVFCEAVQESYGSYELELIETRHGPYMARTRSRDARGCRRGSWAHPDARIIAHEILHAFGHFDYHAKDAHELMYPDPLVSDSVVTADQQDTFYSEVSKLNACK